MSKELEEFGSLFNLTPSVNILHYIEVSNEITQKLESIVLPFGGKVKTIENNPPLNHLRKEAKHHGFDYAIVSCSIVDHDDQNNFMNLISKSLRDSGYMIILEKKEKTLNSVYELLEKYDYGAVNSINIFEEYNLIMAKKLHMWGMD